MKFNVGDMVECITLLNMKVSVGVVIGDGMFHDGTKLFTILWFNDGSKVNYSINSIMNHLHAGVLKVIS